MEGDTGTSKQSKSGRRPNTTGPNKHKSFGKQNDGQLFAADLRKKREARKYIQFLQKEKMNSTPGGEGGARPHISVHDIISRPHKRLGAGGHTFSSVHKIADKNRKLKEEEKEKRQKDKESKEAAIKAYNEKKKDRYKRLCKKTRKGQPIMKYQMEHLLEKVLKHKGMDT